MKRSVKIYQSIVILINRKRKEENDHPESFSLFSFLFPLLKDVIQGNIDSFGAILFSGCYAEVSRNYKVFVHHNS
jgi:hypothetical protein